jgi:hypothetical protein
MATRLAAIHQRDDKAEVDIFGSFIYHYLIGPIHYSSDEIILAAISVVTIRITEDIITPIV